MEEAYSEQPVAADFLNHARDLEEKQRLMRDRVLLLGKTLIENRDKTFAEIQELKGSLIKLKEETARIKELVQRMAEQLSNAARKEELMILQRQFDLFRKA